MKRVVTIRFSDGELAFIKAYAEKWGISLSEAVRMIIHEWMMMVSLMGKMPRELREKVIESLGE